MLSITPPSPWHTVVLCIAVTPLLLTFFSLPFFLSSSFSPHLPGDKTAAAPSVCEDKKSPFLVIPRLTLPPAAGKLEGQLREEGRGGGKGEIAAAHLTHSIQTPSYSWNASWIHTLHAFKLPIVEHEKYSPTKHAVSQSVKSINAADKL